MTAVEWLWEQIENKQPNLSWYKIFEQAKEMEKQQIVSAGNSCALKQLIHNEMIEKLDSDELLAYSNIDTKTVGEQYYNETYKGK